MQLMKFSELGLAAPILKALHSEGYHTPTEIQVKAIPIILTGCDALGIAQTGTGKTAAFALPVIHRMSADRRSGAAASWSSPPLVNLRARSPNASASMGSISVPPLQ
jgi:superfamily II DNA/RNA helicase